MSRNTAMEKVWTASPAMSTAAHPPPHDPAEQWQLLMKCCGRAGRSTDAVQQPFARWMLLRGPHHQRAA